MATACGKDILKTLFKETADPFLYLERVIQKTEKEMSLKYSHKNVSIARTLRKNATPQENHLWYDFLSSYTVRFQRQKPIDHFIADFYCHKAKLVIEIDGSQHYSENGQKKDQYRTEILEGYDLRIIRFTNIQIDRNFREVCEYIDYVVKEIMNGNRSLPL